MMKLALLVFLGGGIGSTLRYATQFLFAGRGITGSFPWTTFAVNVAGSFLIGLFYALAARLNLSDETKLFLTTGICGGFTTFSTFSNEGVGLLRQGFYGTFIAYVTASIVCGLAATFGGASCGNALLHK